MLPAPTLPFQPEAHARDQKSPRPTMEDGGNVGEGEMWREVGSVCSGGQLWPKPGRRPGFKTGLCLSGDIITLQVLRGQDEMVLYIAQYHSLGTDLRVPGRWFWDRSLEATSPSED